MHELLIYFSRHSMYQGRWMTMLSRWQAKRCKSSKKITYTTLPCRGSFTAVTVTEDTQR